MKKRLLHGEDKMKPFDELPAGVILNGMLMDNNLTNLLMITC